MPVPRSRSLSLSEAASYVADRCEVSLEEAKAAVDRGFREYSLSVFSDHFEKVQGWRGAEIDWENSEVVGGEHLTINGVRYTVRVSVFRQHLDDWMSEAASRARAERPGRSAPTGALSRTAGTGWPGRPSKGKNLIEDEFKRRCSSGQAMASLDAEAGALLSWYTANYPKAPRPTVKTIKNNIRADHRQWIASKPQTNAI